MKSQFLTILLLFFINFITIAQKQIVIQGTNYTKFETNLDSAILHAVNGDKVYLPGGSFLGSFTLTKQIHIIGVGYHTDSTFSTSKSRLEGSIIFQSGSNGSIIEGLDISSNVNWASDNINNITIKKCRIGGSVNINASNFFFSSNNVFINNILPGISMGPNTSNTGVYNNIFLGIISGGSNHIIKNNFFNYNFYNTLSNYWHGFAQNINGGQLDNNIFKGGLNPNSPYTNNTSTFRNNIGLINNGDLGSGIIGYNNINYGILIFDSLVFKCSQNSNFINDVNLRLRPNSPGHNAGTDGTDIGIYGGAFPWKDGGLPNNPHIKFQQINNTTDNNGKLRINIKVAAQDN